MMKKKQSQPKPNKTVWDIDESIEKVLARYPELRKRAYGNKCLSCKEFIPLNNAFVTGDYIGVKTEPCKCGANPLFITTARNKGIK